jgi:hypothetical protein
MIVESDAVQPGTGVAELLASPRQKIDEIFVNVGEKLTRSASLLEQISAAFEALPGELDRPELAEATQQLATVSIRAGEISAAFAREQGDLTRLVELVGSAQRPVEDLRRSIRMMGILSINARVVSASVRGLENSDVFTSDIATLSSSAFETIGLFSQVYETLAHQVREAAATRARFEQRHSSSLDDLSRKIALSVNEVTAQRQRSAEESSETARVTRSINQGVMTAVMALQVGDATRQRVEHVEHSLAISSELAPETGTAIAALGAAQLNDTIATLDAEVAEAQRALGTLADDAQQITIRSQQVYGEGGTGGSALSLLSEQTRLAVMVLRDCEGERQKLGEVTSAVEATVKQMIGHVEAVQDIEANMRLVSLNAAIRCAQLGTEGAALNVIARQLRDLTGETVAAADAAADRLRQTAELALAFSAAAGDETLNQVARLERQALDGLGLMESVETRIRTALVVLGQAAPKVASLLNAAISDFSDHGAIAEALADVEMQLTEQGQDAATSASPGTELAETLARIRRSYTMEGERRIHDGMWGRPEPAVAKVTTEDDDGLGLFDITTADVGTTEPQEDADVLFF